MPDRDGTIYKNYWGLILAAGGAETRDELISIIDANADALEDGAQATMQLLASGTLHMEEAFTTLDSAKAIAAKNLRTRSMASRSGRHFDQIVSRPDPGHVSYFLRSRHRRTALISFHFVRHDKLAIFAVANAPTRSGIRGFGDVYYDCIWLDGLRDEFVGSIEEYAKSVNRGMPDLDLVRTEFDFIGSAMLALISTPNPDEVIIIPHKLLHILPLHAISFEEAGKRTYLHDLVRSIHYASSFESLAFSGLSFLEKKEIQNRQYRYLSVLDTNANLPGISLERKCIDVYREQLEPKGVQFDIISDALDLPENQRDYIWINWSSHGKSSPNAWGDSFLMLGEKRINALTIANEWQFDLRPNVILAACESGIDFSGGFHIDEYCGLDIAFQIAGAGSTIASLWSVEDLVSALTAMIVPAWWFQGQLPPADSLTALQKALCSGTWKQFLLRDEKLKLMPPRLANTMKAVQEPFWRMREDTFKEEGIWAAFRAHGT